MCSHTNQKGSWKVLLETGKSDYPVLSILVAVRGITDIDEETLPPAKRHLDAEREEPQ
jgi:hypothetical protein